MRITSSYELEDGNTLTLKMLQGKEIKLQCPMCGEFFLVSSKNIDEAQRDVTSFNVHINSHAVSNG